MIDLSKTVSKQRTSEGALQTGGIFAIITAVIELVRHFFPELPWAQIMPIVGAAVAYFAGGQVSKVVHQRQVAKHGRN